MSNIFTGKNIFNLVPVDKAETSVAITNRMLKAYAGKFEGLSQSEIKMKVSQVLSDLHRTRRITRVRNEAGGPCRFLYVKDKNSKYEKPRRKSRRSKKKSGVSVNELLAALTDMEAAAAKLMKEMNRVIDISLAAEKDLAEIARIREVLNNK